MSQIQDIESDREAIRCVSAVLGMGSGLVKRKAVPNRDGMGWKAVKVQEAKASVRVSFTNNLVKKQVLVVIDAMGYENNLDGHDLVVIFDN